MRENYGRALTDITSKITRWIALPLSLAGRASLIKMVILPKLLYFFTNIPWAPSRHFFAAIQKQMARLVWGGKQARISWETLTRPYAEGGFEIPDLRLYHACAQAHFLSYWMHPPPFMPHLAIEDGYMTPTPSTAYISSVAPPPHMTKTTVHCTVNAWHTLASREHCPILYSPLLPLEGRHDLPVTQEGGFRKLCRTLSIQTWGQLYTNGTFRTHAEFFGEHHPSPLDLFYYIRIRQDMRTLTPGFPNEPMTCQSLHHILQQDTPSHVISRLYSMTQKAQKYTPLQAKARWERDLGTPITDDQWAYCCRQTQEVSASSRLRILHYKYLHRTYYTPERLFRLGLRDSSHCTRCRAENADFLHLAWSCPTIQHYWTDVFAALRDMTGITMPEDPLLALLGYTAPLAPPIRKYTALALLLAKRRVSCRWGRGRAPKFKTWLKDLIYCQETLSTYAELLPPSSRPREIWAPLKHYLQSFPDVLTLDSLPATTTSLTA